MDKIYKGEKTREKIVLAAIDLFGEQGFDHVSLKMIGDKIGISQSAVAQHFGSKRNIILRVRELVTKSNQLFVDSKVRPFDKPTRQIIDYCVANLEWGFKNRKLAQIIILTYYFAMVDEEFQIAQKRSVQIAVERLERHVISFSREEKTLKPSQTYHVANLIHQYLIGTFTREIATHRSKRDASDLENNFNEIVPLLLSRRS